MNRLEQKDFNGIMMKNTRFRLSADPTIGVADLMAPLENYMITKGDRNILNMVRPPTGVTQKTAPDLLWLNKNYQLYLEYAKVAPNSMIPPKKHRTALERLDHHTKCNFTKATTEDWADQVDQAIRLAMKQFRDLKKEMIFRERAFRRVDSVVQKNIQKVLDHLTKVDKESHFDDEDSQQQGEDKAAAKPNFLAIMDGNHTPDEPPTKKVNLSWCRKDSGDSVRLAPGCDVSFRVTPAPLTLREEVCLMGLWRHLSPEEAAHPSPARDWLTGCNPQLSPDRAYYQYQEICEEEHLMCRNLCRYWVDV